MGSRFDSAQFIRFLLEHRVVGFFQNAVTLKSGRRSHWYVNWRTVAGDAFLLDQLSDFLMAFTRDAGLVPESFYGVPEGASKLGVITTFKWAKQQKCFAPGSHALPMGRGKPKEHGATDDRFFLTPPRGDIVVVEDVTTTGGSLISTLEQLKQLKVSVLAAIGLTNRMELRDDGKEVKAAVEELGVPYLSLCQAQDFLPEAYRAFAPGMAVAEEIERERREYGSSEIRLLS